MQDLHETRRFYHGNSLTRASVTRYRVALVSDSKNLCDTTFTPIKVLVKLSRVAFCTCYVSSYTVQPHLIVIYLLLVFYLTEWMLCPNKIK